MLCVLPTGSKIGSCFILRIRVTERTLASVCLFVLSVKGTISHLGDKYSKMADKDGIMLSQVIAALNELHTTTDQKRRRELNDALTTLKKSENGFMISFRLLDFEQTTIVQHFGACIFYDTIRERWEECISNEALIIKIKETLLEKLAFGAPFLNQSVTNKLTSSLAMLALCCVPDIWPDPIQDLAAMWNDKPELLLRVLAELAAEFYRIRLPLSQRSILKSSLHRKAEDVIKIINMILCDKDASPSLRNAAVECLEQWLRLPGTELMRWQPALLPFLGNLSDRVALARILNVISAHSDLPYMECLAMDLATFLASITCPAIVEQLDILNKRYKEKNGMSREDYISELEEYGFLVSALAEFFEATMRPLLIGCVEKRNGEVLRLLCTFFEKISLWPGFYPYDEVISDTSEIFWNTLKDDLLSLPGSRVNETAQHELIAECSTFYIRLQWCAITKLSYPPQDVFQLFDKDQVEKFERYRFQRVEVSLNAFEIAPTDSTFMLVRLLGEAVSETDICKVEAILYLLERIADYMTENDAATINRILEHCVSLLSWHLTDEIYGASQLGKSLMNLFYSLSHLICTGSEADKQGTICMELALTFVDITGCTEEALKNLEKYVESRTLHLDVMDRVVQKCYEYFCDNQKPRILRICALRCLGLSLAVHESNYVLKSLDSILTPRLKILQMIVEGHLPTSSQSTETLEDECIFELDVLSALVSTQKTQTTVSADESEPKVKNLSKKTVHIVLWQAMPLLLDLLRNFSSSEILVERICDVLRSGLIAVQDDTETLLNSYCGVLDFILLKHPAAACKLAKSVVLICSSNNLNDVMVKLATRIAGWFKNINESMDEFNEEHIELAYHIVKKDWKFVCSSLPDGYIFLRALLHMSLKILATSKDTNLCRKDSVMLATMIRNIITSCVFTEVLQEAGESLISVVFSRLQTELMKSTAEALSEILMLLARNYPLETRQCLNGLPYGNTQEVVNMLKETHNAKNFKHMALQFNMQRRKEIKI
uniref:Exportin-1/Importin-beta-like domain-containing protein n=1 Tax=Setaria digitata TaxID=48799 RepID=A0A915PS32_9BILA